MILAAVPAKAEDSELDKAKKRADDAEDRAKKAEEDLADYKKKAEAKAEEDKKASAAAPPKKDPPEEDSTANVDPEARAMACLCATVQTLTGAANLEDAEARIVAVYERAQRVPDLEKSKHVARVEKMIASGQLTPARRDWALKAKASQLDAFLEATGGEPIVSIGSEHSEDPAVRAKAEGEITTLTAEEKAVAKHLGLTDAEALAAAKTRSERYNQAR
jgi:hypothetical protein